ncbi:MAG: HNH endonuclease [Alphaproteobacteria bacterium]|nr:HNH endonuclease [Alphaproteobacteria bacterium]
MSELATLEPKQLIRLMDVLSSAGFDVSEWSKNFKGKHPSTNPKYCYEWSFNAPDRVLLTFWFTDISEENGKIFREMNMRVRATKIFQKGAKRKRAENYDAALRYAYDNRLPVYIALCIRDPKSKDASSAKSLKRVLDTKTWAVVSYDHQTGDARIERGANPNNELMDIISAEVDFDDDADAHEGQKQKIYVTHRKRESRLRIDKIRQHLARNGGRLACEVPKCGFDFFKIYGEAGRDFAHVHHIDPLYNSPDEGRKVTLDDLAIVCANCHAIIHRKGGCLPMHDLIKSSTAIE